MLNALLGLDLRVDFGGGGSYKACQPMYLLIQRTAHSLLPAAAAGSKPDFFAESTAGLAVSLPIGLLLRLDSVFFAAGDFERRSKRDVLLGSGSVWSNRDRFAVRRSVSSIVGDQQRGLIRMKSASWMLEYTTNKWEKRCAWNTSCCNLNFIDVFLKIAHAR